MTAMVPARRRWVTLVLLAAWVLLGPVGMAFDTCAAMMAMCDGAPCGVASAVIDATPSFAAPVPLSVAVAAAAETIAFLSPAALEPPPKSVRLLA
jgi:hypothetical protein